ncbi:MAG: hypothetical protein Q9168_007111, partial [Polycauliona sp. 1 TL-2023]
ERQPSCSACERLGVPCPGPRERTVFIQEHPGEWCKVQSSKTTPDSTATQRLEASTNSPLDLTTKSQALLPIQCLNTSQKRRIIMPKEDHFTSLFVNKFKTEPVQGSTPFSWLHHGLVAYNGSASISHRFAQNVTQAFFGHYFALPEVVKAAQLEYGKNLLLLKESLDVPEAIGCEDLFRGILTAVIFELITQTSSSAWAMHILALARIIQSRGPDVYQSLSERSGLAMSRSIM